MADENDLRRLVEDKGLVYAAEGDGSARTYQVWERFPQETVEASGHLLVGDADLERALSAVRKYQPPGG